jgi:hypothetical protein
MCLGPNKLTISKLDNIEPREIMRATRSNINLILCTVWDYGMASQFIAHGIEF